MRDRQKVRARGIANNAARDGKIPHVKTLNCMDCGEPAQEYDHFRGYSDAHALDVQPVCKLCHLVRKRVRKGEILRGEDSSNVKLDTMRVREICALRATGMRLSELAAKFGVRESTISRIANRRLWQHVP